MNAYGRFYTENKAQLYAFLLRMTGDAHLALDLVQESFTRYLSRYGGDGSHVGLLYAIARNAALDSLRKRREEPLHGDQDASFDADPERQLIGKETYGKLMAAIQQLSPVDRELIALLATERFSYREIGKLLNISEANVKVKVHRSRMRLRENLQRRS